MKSLFTIGVFVVGISVAWAIGVDEQVLPDPAQETRAREIMKELRCLVCQNQSIDESGADMAADLRGVVRERIVAGDSNSEVRAYMVQRFGDWILMRPPMNRGTGLLWLMPILLLLVGAIGILIYMRRQKTGPETPLSPEETAAIDQVLRGDD